MINQTLVKLVLILGLVDLFLNGAYNIFGVQIAHGKKHWVLNYVSRLLFRSSEIMVAKNSLFDENSNQTNFIHSNNQQRLARINSFKYFHPIKYLSPMVEFFSSPTIDTFSVEFLRLS